MTDKQSVTGLSLAEFRARLVELVGGWKTLADVRAGLPEALLSCYWWQEIAREQPAEPKPPDPVPALIVRLDALERRLAASEDALAEARAEVGRVRAERLPRPEKPTGGTRAGEAARQWAAAHPEARRG